MKKYFIGVGLFLINVAFSQTLPILTTTSLANPEHDLDTAKKGNYAIDKNNERQQYVGLWQYTYGNDIFQIKITKQDQVLNKIEYNGEVSQYNYVDKIIIRYRLVKNGMEIYNNLSENNIDTVNAWGIKQLSRDYLYGRFFDHTRNVIGSYTIRNITQPGSMPKILFEMDRFNYRLLNSPAYYEDGQPLFSIPQGIIEMIKVN